MKTETAKATKQEIFTKLQKSVALDKRLEKTTASLFLKMLGLAMISNFTTMTFSAKIEQLAEALAMSTRTVRRHLPKLIRFGYVLASRHKSGRKMNMPNVYTMLNPFEESQQRLCEANSVKILGQDWQANTIETLSRDIRTKETNIREAETSSVVFSTPSYVTPEALSETPKVSEANLNETDCEKPEVQSPKQKTISKAKTAKPEMDVSNVPDNLKPTARLLLCLSERTKLKEDEVKLLVLLLEKHFPARIQGEIERQAERFKKEGRNMHSLQVFLLYEILKNQRSRPLDEPETEAPQAVTDPQTEAIYERVISPRRKSNKKAAKRAPKAEHNPQSIPETVSNPVEFVIPIAEAEKVIADYQTEHAKKPEPTPAIPVALEELFNKMQTRENERIDEYFEALPKDEYGDYVLPEDGGVSDMPIEDYLHLKYPEAEEEELCRDYGGHVYSSVREHPEAGRIQAAFEIDYACAMCMNPENCQLPEGVKKEQPKLVTKIFTCKDGKKCLGTGFEGRIKCKHNCPKPNEKTPEEKRQEAEFEHLLSYSGIVRKDKTFENYNTGVPELVVAEAMAILAVKTGKNLVLAGRAGTGKTHLATAIAIEVMKAGRQARVTTANEMLDRICQAYRDNADPLGVLLKYKRVPVLVIDDWDKAKMSDARLDYLYQIIDYRYERGLQTIVTTNAYSMNELKLPRWCNSSIEPIMSRLLENGDWVTIREAENYRLKKSAPAVSVPEVTPVAEEPAIEAEPEEPARSGKISLTETTLPVDEEPARAEPETPSATLYSEAEVFAECEQIEAEMQSDVSELAEEVQAEIEAEYCATQQSELEMPKEIPETLPEPEPPVKTWQEISQSPEYQALSESDKLKRQWEYLRETPEYKDMWDGDKVAVQLEFARKIREAERLAKAEPKPEPPKPVKQKGQQQETRKEPPKPVEHEQLTFDFKFEDEPAKPEPPKPQEPKPCGIVIYVPRHDDGLDDDEGDIRL